MVKRERVITRLIRYPFEKLVREELSYLENGLKELYTTIERTPIRKEVTMRRYGFTSGEYDWLKDNKEEIMKGIQDCKRKCKKGERSTIFPMKEIIQDLHDNKAYIVGMLRDGARPKDIFEEFRIYPNERAWITFRDELQKEGYKVSRKTRRSRENVQYA